jgi:hypothetical protein
MKNASAKQQREKVRTERMLPQLDMLLEGLSLSDDYDKVADVVARHLGTHLYIAMDYFDRLNKEGVAEEISHIFEWLDMSSEEALAVLEQVVYLQKAKGEDK